MCTKCLESETFPDAATGCTACTGDVADNVCTACGDFAKFDTTLKFCDYCVVNLETSECETCGANKTVVEGVCADCVGTV